MAPGWSLEHVEEGNRIPLRHEELLTGSNDQIQKRCWITQPPRRRRPRALFGKFAAVPNRSELPRSRFADHKEGADPTRQGAQPHFANNEHPGNNLRILTALTPWGSVLTDSNAVRREDAAMVLKQRTQRRPYPQQRVARGRS